MINSLFILATEAQEAAESGFGLDFNILETNLFNLAILVGVVFYFGRNTLGNILAERQAKIAEAIQEAEERRDNAAKALAVEQENLAQAKAQAQKIVQTAQERTQSVQNAIAEQAEKDIQRLRETAAADLSSEQARVIAQLQQQIAAMALEKVEGQLKATLNESKQQLLLDRTIAGLGGN